MYDELQMHVSNAWCVLYASDELTTLSINSLKHWSSFAYTLRLCLALTRMMTAPFIDNLIEFCTAKNYQCRE